MSPETRKLITFADCSNPASSFAIVFSGYIYIRADFCNKILITHLGWIVWGATYVFRNHCLEAAYVKDVQICFGVEFLRCLYLMCVFIFYSHVN